MTTTTITNNSETQEKTAMEKLEEGLLTPDEAYRIFDIRKISGWFLHYEPFFSSFSARLIKRPSTRIPTACVGFDSRRGAYFLEFNPHFFRTLYEQGLRDHPNDPACYIITVLLHEYYHIIFGHVSKNQGGFSPKIWNYATDLAINSIISEHYHIPPGGLLPGRDPFKHYEPNLSSIDYAGKLTRELKEKLESLEGMGFDDHSPWEEGMSQAEEVNAKHALIRQIRDSLKTTMQIKDNWGTVPQAIRGQIKKFIADRSIDWKEEIRKFGRGLVKAEKRKTVMRRNKRFPWSSGVRTNRLARLAVCMDESGSVSDQMRDAFCQVISSLTEHIEVVFVPFDHEVAEDDIWVWKKNQKPEFGRVACGGTNFDAPSDYVNSENFDGMIIFTDLCAPVPRRSKTKRLWITSKEYEHLSPEFTSSLGERVLIINAEE